ncbi:MAG: acyltransferase [Bacteroidales bacterium]
MTMEITPANENEYIQMKQRFDFEDIRPLYDEEVPEVMTSLLKEPAVEHFIHYLAPEVPLDTFKQQLAGLTNKFDFQSKVVAPFLWKLADKTTTSLDMGGADELSHQDSYTFISNHRDIILDAAFLNILLFKHGFDTAEVAIGDNLLVYQWIRNLVRMNKSFIVKRDIPVRQMLEVSRRLSTYIHFALKIKGQSVWISQREGRSKDSTDRTQEGLVKMLALGGGKDFLRSVRTLNIAPVAISYEYDPCDYLKAKEFQQKRDNPDHKKQKKDDLINMETGLTGFKGRVHFQIAPPIKPLLENIPADMDKASVVSLVTGLIDKEIHRNMRMYPGNYIAYDLLYKTDKYRDQYTAEEEQSFKDYIQGQLNKIVLEQKDDEFLMMKLLEMYSNPLINFEKANA